MTAEMEKSKNTNFNMAASGEVICRLLETAEDEVGYIEKSREAWERDPECLEDKTAGAGFDNYTKYGRDMHAIQPSNMDFPAYWCDAFVDWCFLKTFGEAQARMLLGDFDDYTVNSAKHFQERGLWSGSDERPNPGDQVFFRNEKRICHTGIVINATQDRLYTIEGNTYEEGKEEEQEALHGGAVVHKSYALSDPRIAGYGRPPYDDVSESMIDTPEKR